jgi:hypothetical protein
MVSYRGSISLFGLAGSTVGDQSNSFIARFLSPLRDAGALTSQAEFPIDDEQR